MIIINLTQHHATSEQKKAGVVDLPTNYKNRLIELLTFDELPKYVGREKRAEEIANLAKEFIRQNAIKGSVSAMIGGAPYLMCPLELSLSRRGIKPLYAFSKRESIEEVQEDGTVIKKSIFKHVGFVEV